MKRTLPLLALAALLAGGCALFPPRAESFGSLLVRAEAGDADAQNEVGNCYLHGNGVERNKAVAAEWYRKSAEQECARGEYNLGASFFRGDGVETNLVAAFEWMKKSADHDYPLAWFALGTFYEEGTGVEKDGAEALRWYRKAAESDHGQARAFAQNSVGRCYQFGIGVGRNEQEALVWYLKSAEAGNPAAMDNLAHFYTIGVGGTRDLEAARSWREKARAVSPDDPVFGRSVRDLLDGDRELRELRERDTLTPDEQFEVGSALVEGARNAFDPDEGFRLLRQAAEGGSRNAQRFLASTYAYGYCGVEKNPAEFLRYFRMDAKSGGPELQAWMGGALCGGWLGVKKDFRESAYWFL